MGSGSRRGGCGGLMTWGKVSCAVCGVCGGGCTGAWASRATGCGGGYDIAVAAGETGDGLGRDVDGLRGSGTEVICGPVGIMGISGAGGVGGICWGEGSPCRSRFFCSSVAIRVLIRVIL